MKKLLTITFCGAALLFGFSSSAQSQGDFRAQVGGILGTEAAVDGVGFGLNIGAEYFVSDVISIAPSYDMFFKEDINDSFFGNYEYKLSSINIDGRYYFSDGFYGLAGLSLASVSIFGISANETGLNIGAGYNLAMGESLLLNLQGKYNTPLSQVVAQVGVAFSF
jgi:hypothetical protein